MNYSANVPQGDIINDTVSDDLNVGVNDGVNVGVNVGVKMSKFEFDVYKEIIKNNDFTAEEILKNHIDKEEKKMSDLQVKTIDAIKKLDEKKLEKVSKYIFYIEKSNFSDIPNNDTIESFIEGEELLNDPNTKYYNNIDELKEALGV